MAMYFQKSVIATAILTTSIIAGHAMGIDGDIGDINGYMSNQNLDDAMRSIADSNDRAWVQSIGTSLDGQPIELITLAGSKDAADQRPALLITAGLDGRYLVGSEMAIRIASRILDEHSEMLDSMTIYIIPRVNPDGAARNLESLTMGYAGNARLADDDRDRAMGEDGPDDLNGDGLITMMRRLNPPIEDQPTHLADPDDPRLNIKPDAKEGHRASFTLYTEGIDNDGDGQINEDGFGMVDLNQNFMHDWPEYGTHAGRYPLSEPESKALAQFVIGHDNIVMALTLGRHDNLVNAPESKKKNITKRAPKGIDAKDVDLYKHAAELFKEATGQESAPKADIAGSFHAWLYAQRGIPSFATTVWSRPKIEKNESKEETQEKASPESTKLETESAADNSGLTPSGVGDISQETIDELMEAYIAATGEEADESMIAMVTPEMIEGFAVQAGVKVRRIVEPEPEQSKVKKADKKDKKKKKSDDAKWLEYFEHAGINGFVDWTPFDHPTLGPVEIGGFVPLAKINPPADQLDELAEKQAAFVIELMASRPEVSVAGPEIKELAKGLYEVRIAIVNDGEMPTSTVYSQTSHTIRPMVIRMSAQVDHILTGQRVARVWGINANGGRSEHHWIIRSDDIEQETIEIIDPRFGNQTIHLGN